MPDQELPMERIDVAALYDERGDVAWTRPIIQGDVFDGIVLPGFSDEQQIVQVVAHPCAMRRDPISPSGSPSLRSGDTNWWKVAATRAGTGT